MDPVAAKRYKFAARREFSQRKKWKAAQVRDPRAKRDFSAAKRRVSMEMQPYVITVDDSLASTATMPTAAAVPEGGGEDGYRTVLEIIARSTQPCIGIYVAGDSLAPTAGGRWWRLQHGQTLWQLGCCVYLLEWIRVFAELLVAVVDKFGWCVISQYLWVLSFGVNKLENSGTWLWFMWVIT